MSHLNPTASPVLDVLAPFTFVTLGDQKLGLRIDFNALCSLEASGGTTSISADMFKNLKMKQVRAMLTAALQAALPGITEAQVGAMIHMGNLKETVQALGEAWEVAFSGPDGSGVRPLELKPGPVAVPAAA